MYSSPTDSQALPAGTHLLEFVIERVLGAGGFGITYLAKDTSLSRKVVIKENMPTQFAWRDSTSGTVRPRHSTGSDVEDYEWSMKNFLREAETLASLDHPSIVKVLRQFEANGTAYFVMPYVEGLALDELAKQRVDKPFCEEELRGLLERMLDALAYLHDRGIYHRDIKPANILISNQGMPAMIDFGSARQRLSERSMTVVESAGYTPFEQLQTRGNVGPWSDLYALAATLVKVMTGEAPPKANDRSFGDPWQPLAVRQELLGRYSARFLECLDRALRLPIQERWQNSEQWKMTMREETDVELPREVKPMLKPTTARTSRAFKSANNTEKKAKYIPWIVGACVLFSLLVVAKIITGSNVETAEQVTDAYQKVILSERDKAEAAAAQARVAEQRVYQSEREKRSLMEQAQANGGMPIDGSDGAILKDPKAGDEREFEIAPGVKMTFCWCPPGEFMMGSPEGEAERDNDEVQHRVKLTKGFWMGKYEVTQKQWTATLGTNPSHFKGDNLPVEEVSWNDVQRFLGGLNAKIGNTDGGQMALPTEAQWEYACRAGEQGPYSGGTIDEVSWYDDNSEDETHAVGKKKSNAWGLHDMHGNVWEWCCDWYGECPEGLLTDPSGPLMGTRRVLRGGSWFSNASNCRAAYRSNSGTPSFTYDISGFRVARSSVP